MTSGQSYVLDARPPPLLAGDGFHEFCVTRRKDRITPLAEEIGGTAVVCDVTDAGSVATLADAVGDRLDMLVNDAGGAFDAATVEQADVEIWARMYDVNVLGTVRVTQALPPALPASGNGLVVNLGSTAGRIAYEGGGGYIAAKHGTKVLTETLRLGHVAELVRFTEIAPGMVRTEGFGLRRFDGEEARGIQCTPAWPSL